MPECPRWRLVEPHYINVPTLPDGTRVEWEHKETARESGRTVRKLFPVPILLNPGDPADCNYPGEIIVAHDVDGGHHFRQDYLFLGDPTPGMEPLNEEAEAITASLRPKWEHPIDTLPVNGGMNPAELVFMEKMMTEFAKNVGSAIPSTGNAVVSRESYDELKDRLEKLEATIAAQGKPSNGERRV